MHRPSRRPLRAASLNYFRLLRASPTCRSVLSNCSSNLALGSCRCRLKSNDLIASNRSEMGGGGSHEPEAARPP